MADPLGVLEAWLTYINVQVLGLKPFHFNWVKMSVLLFGLGGLGWVNYSRFSAKHVARFICWLRGVSPQWLTLITCSLLTIGVACLSLKQYYSFTTEAFDLAIYSNSLWHTIHGAWLWDSVKNEPLLGDHFGPILIVVAQLYRVYESPIWLLLLQVLALGLGGVALGLITYRITGSNVSTLVLLILYVSNPYLHSIAALDFHPIALAIPIFLWMLYCLDTERYWAALVLAVLSLLVEESLPPGLVGVGLYLFFFRPQYRWTGMGLAFVGATWFWVTVTFFLPHFSGHALIHWDRYANLGPNFREALYNLLTNPLFLMREAFVSHHKIYYLAALFFSVLFLPLLAWRQATLIVLPALMMLLSQNGGHYKFGFHYSAAVLPFLFYSAAHGMPGARSLLKTCWPAWARTERFLCSVVIALLVLHVYQIRGYRVGHEDARHVEAIREIIDSVPPRVSVRAEGYMVPMLSNRHRVAFTEDRADENFAWWEPDFIVVDLKNARLESAQRVLRKELLEELTQKRQYSVVTASDGVILLKHASS